MFDFGLRIQQLRMSRNMSLADLGKKIGRSKATVRGYENNYKTPPLDVLVSIATVFNVSLDYLVGIDKEEMVPLAGLTDGQKETIYALIGEFKKGTSAGSGLTPKEQEVLNRVLVEFNKLHC